MDCPHGKGLQTQAFSKRLMGFEPTTFCMASSPAVLQCAGPDPIAKPSPDRRRQGHRPARSCRRPVAGPRRSASPRPCREDGGRPRVLRAPAGTETGGRMSQPRRVQFIGGVPFPFVEDDRRRAPAWSTSTAACAATTTHRPRGRTNAARERGSRSSTRTAPTALAGAWAMTGPAASTYPADCVSGGSSLWRRACLVA